VTNQAAKDRQPLKPSRPRPGEALADRKEKFAALLAFVGKRNGWLTSVAGAVEVEMQCLPGSTLPDELRALGYDLREDGEGERILPHGIVERFARGPGGELVPITAESTRPVAETRTHAGIVTVRRFAFSLA